MHFYKPPKGAPHCPTHGQPLRAEPVVSTLWNAYRCIQGGEVHFKSKGAKNPKWVRPNEPFHKTLLTL